MIRFEDGEYEFDFEKVSLPEYREIKRKLGLTIRTFMEGVELADPDAVTALYWLVLRTDGKHDDLVLADDLDFDVFRFLEAWVAHEREKAAEPDPTQAGSPPDGSTPGSASSSTGTSTASPPSTSSRSHAGAGSANGKSAGSPSVASSAT